MISKCSYGGVVGFLADLFTGAGKATKKAVQASQYATDTSNALARDIFDKTTQRIDPYATGGLAARDYYNALVGLPSSVSLEDARTGFDNYLNTAGFDDEYEQGVRGIVGGQAARRMLGSGSTLKSLERFRQGLKGQYFGNYLNSVGNQQALGLNAATSLAGVGSQYTGQVTQNNMQNAATIGNAALARSASNTNFLSGLIGAAATLSDERAKTITAKVGEMEDGLPIYRFRYTGSDIEHVGPMAQEVALYRPWALGPRRDDGMMTVDYSMLEAA